MRYAKTCLVLSLVTMLLPAYGQSANIPLIENKAMLDESNPNLPAGSHQFQAQKLMSEGKLKEAEQEANIALGRAKKIGDPQAVASCNFELAKIYRRENRNDDSLKLYQAVLDYYKTQEKPGWIEAMVLNNIGEIYRSTGQYDKAVSTLLEAKSKTDDKAPNYCAIVENLGYAYMKMGKPKEAEEALKEAVATAEAGHDRRSLTDSEAALTLLLYKQSRLDETRTILPKATTDAEMTYGPSGEAPMLLNKIKKELGAADEYDSSMKAGMAAMHANSYAEGLTNFLKAQSALEGLGMHEGPGILVAMFCQANAYLATEKYQMAEETVNKSIGMYHHISMNKPELLAAMELMLKKVKDIEATTR